MQLLGACTGFYGGLVSLGALVVAAAKALAAGPRRPGAALAQPPHPAGDVERG